MNRPDESADEHRWAQQALPWLVNQTLDENDTLRLRAHLRCCADCRSEYEMEQALFQRLAVTPVVDYAPQASLAKLMQLIEAETPPGLPTDEQAKAPRRRRSTLAFAFVAQAAALAVLAVALSWLALRPVATPGTGYQTLSSASPASRPHLQVVFSEHLTTAEQRALLQQVQGHIIDGPSAAGLFLVAIDTPEQGDQRAALVAATEQLRGMAGVRFVALPPAPVTSP